MHPEFAREIADAASVTYRALLAAHPDEHFYAFALYTDSGAMTVVPAANSEEGLKRVRERMEIGDDEKAPEFTWATGEWAYESAEADSFNPLCERLADTVLGPEIPEAKFGEFFRDLQRDMIEALRLLDQEGLFGTGAAREKITLFVTISDDNGAEALENESAKILNPPAVFDRFINRYA
ncbi:hypothetical protein BLA13014_07234 [Burkholderia aenigmatica]|uniref:DUF4303 domain-containing protein n=1 Tax=Burkholderia aenigmatica TaxID=2015348 RepID=A0A6P2S6G3_9BURK|nr:MULTISPECIES: DUF4303 domain-containing protein [Burkholderia]MDN7515163.1 DUF4303 domain-containing protein [Burkholderia sp. AU45251]VWC45423.1 hypothetical protein BLA13014_07234 [Burkholderia aenigmatica]HDR9482201.1 DUF4303 domain-containing protein [Burkholderia aenigmatica]HDR9515668.1 DUF4303 domain-containing protein [Burkholderia aenigmatica]HDR9590572.1 DUF4303 domain-containing protein [Burkholderia aenigmatica]